MGGEGWGGTRVGGRAGGLAGRRLGAWRRRMGPRSSSWTAGSGSPLRTCRSWWWTSRSCSWKVGAVVAGAATVVAGAQGLGGPEEESGLWAAHWHPQGPMAQPHLRQPRGGASGLQRRDKSLASPGRLHRGVFTDCLLGKVGRARATKRLSRPPPDAWTLGQHQQAVASQVPLSQRAASSCYLCDLCSCPDAISLFLVTRASIPPLAVLGPLALSSHQLLAEPACKHGAPAALGTQPPHPGMNTCRHVWGPSACVSSRNLVAGTCCAAVCSTAPSPQPGSWSNESGAFRREWTD